MEVFAQLFLCDSETPIVATIFNLDVTGWFGRAPPSACRHEQPLSTGEAIFLANQLVAGTSLEETIIEYKKKINAKVDDRGRNQDGPLLGASWWRIFYCRNSHRLTSQKGRKSSLK